MLMVPNSIWRTSIMVSMLWSVIFVVYGVRLTVRVHTAGSTMPKFLTADDTKLDKDEGHGLYPLIGYFSHVRLTGLWAYCCGYVHYLGGVSKGASPCEVRARGRGARVMKYFSLLLYFDQPAWVTSLRIQNKNTAMEAVSYLPEGQSWYIVSVVNIRYSCTAVYILVCTAWKFAPNTHSIIHVHAGCHTGGGGGGGKGGYPPPNPSFPPPLDIRPELN